MPRKVTATSLKKKADDIVAKIIKKNGKCDRCGRTENQVQLQCAHIVGRSNHTLRFDLMNVLSLCASCHRWGHNNPDAFTDWWRAKYPHRKNYIDKMRNVKTKRTIADYQLMIRELQMLL